MTCNHWSTLTHSLLIWGLSRRQDSCDLKLQEASWSSSQNGELFSKNVGRKLMSPPDTQPALHVVPRMQVASNNLPLTDLMCFRLLEPQEKLLKTLHLSLLLAKRDYGMFPNHLTTYPVPLQSLRTGQP